MTYYEEELMTEKNISTCWYTKYAKPKKKTCKAGTFMNSFYVSCIFNNNALSICNRYWGTEYNKEEKSPLFQ